MKKMNLKMYLIVLIFSQSASAESYLRPFSQGLIQGNLDIQYFKTEANFDSGGNQQSLLSGSSYQIINYDIGARYNLLDALALRLTTSIGQAESNDVLASRSSSTLTHVSGAAEYLFLNTESLFSYIDVSYKHALEKVDMATDSALNSDGASELHGQIFAVYDFDYFEAIGSFGANYRLEGLSTLLTYSAGVQYGFDQLQVGGLIKGVASVVDDSKTNSSFERDFVTTRVNGGSKKFYSINPNLTWAEAFVNFEINPSFSLKGFGGYTLVGSNAAVGYHVGGSLTFTFDGFASKSSMSEVDRPVQTPHVPAKPVVKEPPRKFKENTNDGVDQEIFKPVAPSEEGFVKPLDDDEMKIVPKKALPVYDPDYKIKLKKKKKLKKRPKS